MITSNRYGFLVIISLIFLQSCGQHIDSILLLKKVPVEKTINGNEIIKYSYQLEKDDFLQVDVKQLGADIVLEVYSPSGKKLAEVDSPTGDTGTESCSLSAEESGIYAIEVKPFVDEKTIAGSGKYTVEIVRHLSGPENKIRLENEQKSLDSIFTWISTNSIPVKHVTAGHGFEDLMPLKKMLAQVSVVALGEATHGTREFFQFKHRMVEFLVTEMGFTHFGLEASYTACIPINDYVLYGKGDLKTVLAGQGFYTWKTEEVGDLIEWMRVYNLKQEMGKKVQFFGFDSQNTMPMNEPLLLYFKQTYPSKVNDLNEIQTFVSSRPKGDNLRQIQEETRQKSINIYPIISGMIEYINTTGTSQSSYSKEKTSEILFYLELVRQGADMNYKKDSSDAGYGLKRDKYMAGNIQTILENSGRQSKAIVWAHNSHIRKGEDFMKYPAMGSFAEKIWGDRYYSLGFAFNKGSFQSKLFDLKTGLGVGEPREFTVDNAQKGTWEWFLAQAGLDQYILDFRTTPKSNAVLNWLNSPKGVCREYGAAYTPAMELNRPLEPINLNKYYDGIFFIDSTTRAIPAK